MKESKKFKPSRKYKMNKEELELHLHLIRKGASSHKSAKDYSRKPKHKKNSSNQDY